MKLIQALSVIFLVLFIAGCQVQVENNVGNSNGFNQGGDINLGEGDLKGAKGYYEVTIDRAKELIDENPDIIILDVSPPTMYAEEHIPEALNYYLQGDTFEKDIAKLDREKLYLVYCKSTVSSVSAAENMADIGFENVYRLVSEFQAWKNAGYKTEKGN